MAERLLAQMISDAIHGGLRVREIIHEPDGRLRLLTDAAEIAANSDPLELARAKRREADGKKRALGQ